MTVRTITIQSGLDVVVRSVPRCLPFCTRCSPEGCRRDQARVQQCTHMALVGAFPRWEGEGSLGSMVWREDMVAGVNFQCAVI